MRRLLHGVLLALALGLGLGSGGLLPTAALARQSMSFSPGDRARGHVARARHYGRATRSHGRGAHHARGASHGGSHAASRPASRGGDEGDAAKAVPGKGFTMENGVLTYPAPARFQPKALQHR